MGRKLLIIVAWLVPAVFFIAALSLFLIIKTDGLRNAAEHYASRYLDRDITMESLTLRWGNPLTLSINGLRLANADWGTEPDMARFDGLEASLDPWPLLHGRVFIHHITLTNPQLFLERNVDGIGNWHFRKKTREGESPDPFHELAKDRAHFPTVLDGHITGGLFRMKTSGGALLRFEVKNLLLAAADPALPVTLAIDGAYNGVPARLNVLGESYDVLHKPAHPYAVDLTVTTKSDALRFKGTMTDPLDADGAIGELAINAKVLNEVFPMFGVNLKINMPAELNGHLTRAGDKWALDTFRGSIAGNALTGKIELNEGSRAEPDAIKTTLKFESLNLKKIIDGLTKGGASKSSDIGRLSLQPDAKPGVTLDARLTAKDLFYESIRIGDVDFALVSKPSEISINPLSFTLAGGHAHITATLDGRGKAPHLSARLSLEDAEIARAIRLTESREALSGKFAAHAMLDMTGATLLPALKNSRGGAVVIMNEGEISRSLLEKASMDLRALFRKGKGTAPITCALGIYNMKNGTGDLLPLRLRTGDIILNGAGWIDFINQQVDVTVRSKPSTTSPLALDWPLRFMGPFGKIGLLPAPGSNTGILDQPLTMLMPKNLPPYLQDIAGRSACFN
ncbi:MAG: hypothetical protein JWO78_13 [Micavibrio sp.]|nr:hypothetical protein [Micavibrio sp.]